MSIKQYLVCPQLHIPRWKAGMEEHRSRTRYRNNALTLKYSLDIKFKHARKFEDGLFSTTEVWITKISGFHSILAFTVQIKDSRNVEVKMEDRKEQMCDLSCVSFKSPPYDESALPVAPEDFLITGLHCNTTIYFLVALSRTHIHTQSIILYTFCRLQSPELNTLTRKH